MSEKVTCKALENKEDIERNKESINGNQRERAEKFGQYSCGNSRDFLMIALEYFDYRCPFSGEKFVEYSEKVSNLKTNLSNEHILPLSLGGYDLPQNLVVSGRTI